MVWIRESARFSGQEPAPGRNDEWIELHVRHLLHSVTQDFPSSAGHAAGDNQHFARVRPLAHRVVDGLFDMFDILGRDHRHSVFEEGQLAGVGGDDQPSVRRAATKQDGPAPVLNVGGDLVGIDQRDVSRQGSRDDDRGQEQHPAAEMPGEHGRQQKIQDRGETEQCEVVEPRHERETEQHASANAADTVGDIDSADDRRVAVAVQHGAGQG